eukprot:Em0016g575a
MALIQEKTSPDLTTASSKRRRALTHHSLIQEKTSPDLTTALIQEKTSPDLTTALIQEKTSPDLTTASSKRRRALTSPQPHPREDEP